MLVFALIIVKNKVIILRLVLLQIGLKIRLKYIALLIDRGGPRANIKKNTHDKYINRVMLLPKDIRNTASIDKVPYTPTTADP